VKGEVAMEVGGAVAMEAGRAVAGARGLTATVFVQR